MSQQHLHYAQVRAVIEQMRGESQRSPDAMKWNPV